MSVSWRRERPLLALLAAMFAASAWAWTRVPDRLPVHWNAAGEVDRWGGRGEALLAVPIVATFVYLLLLFVPRIDPGGENYRSFEGPYRTIRLAVLALLAGVHGLLVATALGFRPDVLQILFLAIGGLHLVLGGVMGKLRPNWFIGVRTPWTLSSRRSWQRTHRVAGFLYLAAGLAMIVTTLLWPRAALAVIFAGALGPAVVCIVYSWWIWRHDPERLPPAGTRPAEDGPPV